MRHRTRGILLVTTLSILGVALLVIACDGVYRPVRDGGRPR